MPTVANKRGSGGVSGPSTADMASSKIETTLVDPKELEKMRKSVLSAEQAPALSEMTPDQNTWSQFRDQLGPPFDSERVTLGQCRQIRKDPMVAFGLHYRKVPLARAEWHIDAYDKNGPNPQVAAFVDACLRKIYARFIFQRELCKDFGYQGMTKRFIWENPGGFWVDPKSTDQAKALKPAWDEGEVLPIIWKSPVALRPESTMPTFDEKTGEFTGIAYTQPQGVGRRKTSNAKAQGVQQYDIYHSYWATNMKDDEHGSMYGYPLVGFARDYWWAYRFLYGMSNRAFERLAIPPVLAYHPEGSTLVDTQTQEMRPNWEIALEAAERLRSNAVAAVPSSMATAGLDSSATQREWDFKFMETPYEALSIFNERFNYLNVMKLRGIWVPDLAFIGGNAAGGNTGGNIAEQMAEVLKESLALEMDETDDDINRLWIPQLLTLNFPDFINNGGVARKISHGFKTEDEEFYKQVIQLIGQTNPELLAQVDLVELFRRIGTPLKSPDALEAERSRLANQIAAGAAPAIEPARGGLGIVRNPAANPGVTNGGSSPRPTPAANGNSALGFTHEPAHGMVYMFGGETYSVAAQFADTDTDEFLANLPTSKHYRDKSIRSFMLQLRRLWLGYYRNLFPDFAKHVASAKMEFADLEDYDVAALSVMFANGNSKQDKARRVTAKAAEKMARDLLKSWGQSSEVLEELSSRSRDLLSKILDRQVKLTFLHTNLKGDMDAKTDDIEEFLNNQVGRLIKLTHGTVKDELRAFLTDQIREGLTADEIADQIRAHFTGFEGAKADRVARSETRDVVNAATLLAGESIGLRYTRASDGTQFDAECSDRDGKLFTIREAWKEMRKEHPYGTLGFDLIPRMSFSVQPVAVLPGEAGEDPDCTCWFDATTDTAYMLMDQPPEDKEEFLSNVAELVLS